MGRPQNAAQFSFALEPSLHVKQISLHASRIWLVEAGFDDACCIGQRGKITALIPGAASRPRDRRNDGYSRILANFRADFGDKGCHGRAAPVHKCSQVAVEAHVGQPEGFGHIGGKVDVTCQIV